MNIRLDNAPLTDEQTEQLNSLLQGLEGWQIEWLAGYLSGYRAAQDAMQGQPILLAETTAPSITLTVLYGSQTGNAEGLAKLLAEKAQARGINTNVVDMANYKPKQLKSEQYLAVLTSTHGEGEAPDNALDFYEFLHSRKAPELKQLKYSVLALGDSSYEYFCQTGKDFDTRLAALGATAIVPRTDCDVDYEDAAEQWISKFIDTLTTSQVNVSSGPAHVLSADTANKVKYDRKHPFPATVLTKQKLSGRGSSKEVLHLELSLEGSGLQYEPGDALGVYAQNDPDLVSLLLDELGFSAEDVVEQDNKAQKLADILQHQREITVLTRPMLEQWAELAQSKKLNALLADRNALNEWLQGRDVLDLIQAYPIDGLQPSTFVGLLRKLPPRMYSIASSQAAVEDEVHITVAAVRYTAHQRERGGVASTWLADRLTEESSIPVYIDHNKNFKLPEDNDVPIIMIGPGTGIAPFRGFMQEREERGAKGHNWLFFGDQHFLSDFLYQTEWLAWRKSGLLTDLDVAFSRDQPEKIYVQHRLKQKSQAVWRWLQEGAHLYVCGDADKMASDVNEALLDIISEEGGKSRDEANEYLRQLTREKRYQRDVY
jgi:sulfite reductase (NADPH) flavoprotein alpha-component